MKFFRYSRQKGILLTAVIIVRFGHEYEKETETKILFLKQINCLQLYVSCVNNFFNLNTAKVTEIIFIRLNMCFDYNKNSETTYQYS